ncbi:MAG: S49 family peptidase, partial [Hyphomicrobiaceae bacterium]
MKWPKRKSIVPVIRFNGPIGLATPLRPGLSMTTVAGVIEKAFSMSKLPSVAISINSPGGSPVQSHLIYKRVRQLAVEKKKKVYVFCEDVAASGGYFLALSGDEIYADPSSIIGSIGVISASFGLDKAIERIGVERRVYTSGKSKSFLDPFQPAKTEDIARLKAVQHDVHQAFISVVTERRGGKLSTDDGDLFTGDFWSAERARALGLIDGISDVRSKMRELHGDDIKLKMVARSSGGLISRLLKSAMGLEGHSSLLPSGAMSPADIGEGLLS